jgi:DOMON domain
VRVELAKGDSLVNYAGGSFLLWCASFAANFGEVVIPTTLQGLPGAGDVPLECSATSNSQEPPAIAITPDGFNCEPLTDNFQVRWQVDGENLNVELVGLDIDEGMYLAFGLSGNDNETIMIGADAVVADIDSEGNFRARDIYMGQNAQCSSGEGVCPDGEFGLTNDVMNVSGESASRLTVFCYTRPVTPSDIRAMDSNGVAVDRAIPLTGDAFIVWAIGPVSPTNGFPNFHSVYPGSNREDKNYSLNFGRDVVDNCTPLVTGSSGQSDDATGTDDEMALEEPFTRPVLNAKNDVTEFVAHIGPSGGRRGYSAISGGRVGWGISWYINGLILPEIVLHRGTTYRFLVNGGDDKTQTSQYHPLYITDSIKEDILDSRQPNGKRKVLQLGLLFLRKRRKA